MASLTSPALGQSPCCRAWSKFLRVRLSIWHLQALAAGWISEHAMPATIFVAEISLLGKYLSDGGSCLLNRMVSANVFTHNNSRLSGDFLITNSAGHECTPSQSIHFPGLTRMPRGHRLTLITGLNLPSVPHGCGMGITVVLMQLLQFIAFLLCPLPRACCMVG
jgi:hypothetical protein